MTPSIPPEVADRLGWYVYIYVDRSDGRVFYVGKGHKRRVLAHLGAEGESLKVRTIAELRAAGTEPRLESSPASRPSREGRVTAGDR
jgi:hypothetical protein